jgi:hypothetical protein
METGSALSLKHEISLIGSQGLFLRPPYRKRLLPFYKVYSGIVFRRQANVTGACCRCYAWACLAPHLVQKTLLGDIGEPHLAQVLAPEDSTP